MVSVLSSNQRISHNDNTLDFRSISINVVAIIAVIVTEIHLQQICQRSNYKQDFKT